MADTILFPSLNNAPDAEGYRKAFIVTDTATGAAYAAPVNVEFDPAYIGEKSGQPFINTLSVVTEPDAITISQDPTADSVGAVYVGDTVAQILTRLDLGAANNSGPAAVTRTPFLTLAGATVPADNAYVFQLGDTISEFLVTYSATGASSIDFTITVSIDVQALTAGSVTVSDGAYSSVTATNVTASGNYPVNGQWIAVTSGAQIIASSPANGGEFDGITKQIGLGTIGEAGIKQGFDPRPLNNNATTSYDTALNIAPHVTGSPIDIASGEIYAKATSLAVGAIATTDAAQRGTGAYDNIQAVVVLSSPPAANSFRPGIRSSGAALVVPANWTTDKVAANHARIPSNLDLSGIPEHDTAARQARIAMFKRLNNVWTTSAGQLDLQFVRGTLRGYGRNFAEISGQLRLDARNIHTPLAEKLEILEIECQLGIDWYALAIDGGTWDANGAWCHGRMLSTLIAGILLDDQNMIDVACDPSGQTVGGFFFVSPPFEEAKAYHFVTQNPRTDRPYYVGDGFGIWVGSGGAPQSSADRAKRIVIPQEMLGVPHYVLDNGVVGTIDWQAANTFITYQMTDMASQFANAVFMGGIDTTYDISRLDPFMAYMERYAPLVQGLIDGAVLYGDENWNAVGTEVGISGRQHLDLMVSEMATARWLRGTPASYTPVLKQPGTLAVSGTDVIATASPFAWGNGSPITQTNLEWSIDDGATWTLVADVGSGPHTIVGAGADLSTGMLARWWDINANGAGPKSVNSTVADTVSSTDANLMRRGILYQQIPAVISAEITPISFDYFRPAAGPAVLANVVYLDGQVAAYQVAGGAPVAVLAGVTVSVISGSTFEVVFPSAGRMEVTGRSTIVEQTGVVVEPPPSSVTIVGFSDETNPNNAVAAIPAIATGDLICVAYFENNGNAADLPSGYTNALLRNNGATGADRSIRLAYKVATADSEAIPNATGQPYKAALVLRGPTSILAGAVFIDTNTPTAETPLLIPDFTPAGGATNATFAMGASRSGSSNLGVPAGFSLVTPSIAAHRRTWQYDGGTTPIAGVTTGTVLAAEDAVAWVFEVA